MSNDPLFQKDTLMAKLLESPSIKVKFTKKSGEDRVMHCTLNREILAQCGALLEASPTRIPNPKIVVVYDLDANGWRSFDVNSVYEVCEEI